jgi:Phosphotransferase enzyme family
MILSTSKHTAVKLQTFELHNLLEKTLLEISNCPDWQITGPKIKSRECDIYQASSTRAGIKLAVKCYFQNTSQVAAKQQFNALQKSYPGMIYQCDNFRVPEAFYYDKSHRILLMEWITGKSLHSYLWNPLTYTNQTQILLIKAGRWLRLFHNASLIEMGDSPYSNLLKAINKLKDKDQTRLNNDSSSEDAFNNSYNILQKNVSDRLFFQDYHALSHGDFTPANLIISDKQTSALDVWGNNRRPVHIDMARMVTYLTIAYPLLNQHPLFDTQGNIQQKLFSLFAGYGTDILNPTSFNFKIALLAEYLRRWLVIRNRQFSYKGIVTDRYQILQIKKQISALIACL